MTITSEWQFPEIIVHGMQRESYMLGVAAALKAFEENDKGMKLTVADLSSLTEALQKHIANAKDHMLWPVYAARAKGTDGTALVHIYSGFRGSLRLIIEESKFWEGLRRKSFEGLTHAGVRRVRE